MPTSKSKKPSMESLMECATETSSLPGKLDSPVNAQKARKRIFFSLIVRKSAAADGWNGVSTASRNVKGAITLIFSAKSAENGSKPTDQRKEPATSLLSSVMRTKCRTWPICVMMSQMKATTSSGACRSLNAQMICLTNAVSCAQPMRLSALNNLRSKACQLPSSSSRLLPRTTTTQWCLELRL